MCTLSASVPSAKSPPVQPPLPTPLQLGPLSISTLFSLLELTGRPRGAIPSKVAPRRSIRGLRVRYGDTTFCLVSNLEYRARVRGTLVPTGVAGHRRV